jgi:choline-glycine betaine transporter
LADVLLTDGTGALFVGRDDGTAVTYFNLNTNAVYTPTGTIQNAGLTNTQLRATPLPVLDVTNAESLQSMILLLTRMLNYLNAPMGYDKSLQRARQTAIIESGTVTTVTTVTTVGTVTNQANIGGIQGQILVNGGNMAAWQAAVRARIT